MEFGQPLITGSLLTFGHEENGRTIGYDKGIMLAGGVGYAHADHSALLKQLFDDAGLQLVDFKLEFGRSNGEIVLGDEFSPDGCRLWDKVTGEKKDKDRFRQKLGGVLDAYREVAERLGIVFYS